jgi:hypothetical protein
MNIVPKKQYGKAEDNQLRDKAKKILIYVKLAIPLQALTGPEGSRRLRLPDFKTIGT